MSSQTLGRVSGSNDREVHRAPDFLRPRPAPLLAALDPEPDSQTSSVVTPCHAHARRRWRDRQHLPMSLIAGGGPAWWNIAGNESAHGRLGHHRRGRWREAFDLPSAISPAPSLPRGRPLSGSRRHCRRSCLRGRRGGATVRDRLAQAATESATCRPSPSAGSRQAPSPGPAETGRKTAARG